jgi:hypothetical protein
LCWLASAVAALVLLPIGVGAGPKEDIPSYCPPAGTAVPLTKAMNPSFVADFKGCDIVVEATFLKMGTPQGFKLGGYDVKKNTTFQVLEPEGVAESAFGQSFGTFAGTPKVNSDILFQLKQGEALLLGGAPVKLSTMFGLASIGAAVFHADSVDSQTLSFRLGKPRIESPRTRAR